LVIQQFFKFLFLFPHSIVDHLPCGILKKVSSI
jgi:hypothetical protein